MAVSLYASALDPSTNGQSYEAGDVLYNTDPPMTQRLMSVTFYIFIRGFKLHLMRNPLRALWYRCRTYRNHIAITAESSI